MPELRDDFPFFSQELQDSVSIKVALPETYDARPNEEYTSIYLLDANYFFDDGPGILDEYLVRGVGMTKIVQSLTEAGTIPPSVLVGIGYTEEQRSRFAIEDVASFYAFFAAELIPEIEARFRVRRSASDRVLFGYSGSAHFSTYALLYEAHTGTETFAKFISISGLYDSSLEACRLEEEIHRRSDADAFSGKSLFLAIGQDDPKSELLEAHRAFAAKLVSRGYAGFELTSTEFAGKGHYDIPEFAFAEGLACLFAER